VGELCRTQSDVTVGTSGGIVSNYVCIYIDIRCCRMDYYGSSSFFVHSSPHL
jgi:hypothetical protein